jgi:NADPH-dependent 2,4-dienoyl-CoA reductase/sulfur reductase-like enzyme/rhodanese-related sulfurtransferase
MPSSKRVLIVGGVAGGASCAARLRRLDETAEIHLFDRGLYVSFANCGLPYYVGNVIREEQKLLVATADLFQNRFNIAVHTETEALSIDRENRTLRVKDLRTGQERVEPYDVLVLSPGAGPIRPQVPGIDLDGIFALRTIPDSRKIRDWIETKGAKSAVVIGAGFIGLEMAENLAHRGLHVTLVEKAPHVMPILDPEMAAPVATKLQANRVTVRVGDGLAGFEKRGDRLAVLTESGAAFETDLVLLAVGVRPEVSLAKAAGLTLGARGGIVVDEFLTTSDPHIWAVGDAIEIHDLVTGQEAIVPLAGPANREGRLAAEAIAGRPRPFRGVQATAVCGLFGLTIATTGASERGLRRVGNIAYEKVYLHPGHHAGYYPGARPIHLKLLFRVPDGRILGAQAIGEDGTEKRIDVIAMAIQMGATVFDLEESELCYAPQFGAAKDPVNVAGMIAANFLRGDMALADWDAVPSTSSDVLVVDVREPSEFDTGHLAGATNLPLSQLRVRFEELPKDKELWLCCGVGQRAYYATRFLMQHGYRAKTLSGGMRTAEALGKS